MLKVRLYEHKNRTTLLVIKTMPATHNVKGINLKSLQFQQDGTPIKCKSIQSSEFNFSKAVDRLKRANEWPAKGHLTCLVYMTFFWSHLKRMFIKLGEMISMTQRILHEVAEIYPEVLPNVINGYYNCLAHCQTTERKEFEHLL